MVTPGPRRTRPGLGSANASVKAIGTNSKRRNIQSRSEQMLSASLIRENEKPGIASCGLLFDRAPDGGWRTICLAAKRRRRSAVGAKCESHFHPQKPLALCAGH